MFNNIRELYNCGGSTEIVYGIRRFILWRILELRKILIPYIEENNYQTYNINGIDFKFKYTKDTFDSIYDVKEGKRIIGLIEDEEITSENIPLSAIVANESVDAVFDIGAYFGIYSVLLQQQNPDADLYSFEPNEKNREVLSELLSKNNISARIFDAVVSDESGTTTFYTDPKGTSQSNSTTKTDYFSAIEKRTIALSDFFSENEIEKAFVKIDAEGEELAILRDIFASDIGYLEGVVELHPDKMPTTEDEFVSELSNQCEGYECLGDTSQEQNVTRPMYKFTIIN